MSDEVMNGVGDCVNCGTPGFLEDGCCSTCRESFVDRATDGDFEEEDFENIPADILASFGVDLGAQPVCSACGDDIFTEPVDMIGQDPSTEWLCKTCDKDMGHGEDDDDDDEEDESDW